MKTIYRKPAKKNFLFLSTLLTSLIPLTLVSADDNTSSTSSDQTSDSQSCFKLPSVQYPPHTYQIRMRHLEGSGVGFNKGYSSLDTFIPFIGYSDKFLAFVDARGHVFNDGKWAANAGMGVRFLPSEKTHIFGINAFYDYRQTNHSNFQQIGAGLELLGPIMEFRLNGYFPFGDRKHRYKDKFDGFENHYAFFVQKYDFPFIGGDLEVGSKIYRGKYFSLDGTLGGYYFSGQYGETAGGGFANLKANITPYISMSGNISYDSLFKCRGNGELSINIPFGGRKRLKQNYLNDKQKLYLAERFLEPVGRFEIMVTDNHKKQARAVDSNGDPLFFVFVDNLRGSSDGSIENPFRTLAQAQANSSPGQVIYVFSGDGTTTGMNSGITLQNNQFFIGSVANFDVRTKFGVRTIPAQTKTSPHIANPGSTVVTLANNNTIKGFQFDSGNTGINGISINNATISQNFFSPLITTEGVSFNECAGQLTLSQNNFQTLATGIFVSSATSSNNLVVTDNFMTDTLFNVRIFNGTTGKTNATIRNNTFTGANIGITITPQGITNAIIDQNIFVNNGIAILSNSHTGLAIYDITNNRITNAFSSGISLEVNNNGQGFWNIQGNTLTNMLNSGVILENDGNAATATYVKLVNNKSFTAATQGYVLQNVNGPERFFISGDSLLDLANTNTGTVVGPDAPPNKIGPFTVPGSAVYLPPGIINP